MGVCANFLSHYIFSVFNEVQTHKDCQNQNMVIKRETDCKVAIFPIMFLLCLPVFHQPTVDALSKLCQSVNHCALIRMKVYVMNIQYQA